MKLMREVLNEHGEFVVFVIILIMITWAEYRFFSTLPPGGLGG